ncbi:MAG: hypothetical protein B7X99_02445 [Rhizobiales bacterium 17-65-6]|nr:MAG: hypothetical protein B7Z30_15705 [Rhizobiales bacterium 12-68-15]OYX87377.1 MAG: hypothetical protein B7Y84_11845 [Azorhizobium sp. 32-67-21]OYY08133.1 MAG: hypothetical protein B7Y70_13005 [Rhizobiales bacterium 35-68-8]OZA00937.1 MAG: hypothetical protein B7X99_02445 [Rhizobiales bacterium 17-65-6]
MLSPDRAARRPAFRILRLATLLAVAGALTGCFRPMYASDNTQAGPALKEKLASIQVVRIEGELGNELRNDLIFALTGGAGNPSDAPYKLYMKVKSTSSYAIVNTSSGLPEAKVVRVSADWRMVQAGAEDKPAVASGSAAASASIDVSQERFANYSATRDAEKRAGGTLSEMIKAQLAAFFVKQQQAGTAPVGPAAPPR